MEDESIKRRQLLEETLTNKSRQSLTNQDRITQQFYNKQVKEKRIQTLFMDHTGFSQDGYQFQELLEILKRKGRNLEVTQM